jgi:hypothetical protein
MAGGVCAPLPVAEPSVPLDVLLPDVQTLHLNDPNKGFTVLGPFACLAKGSTDDLEPANRGYCVPTVSPTIQGQGGLRVKFLRSLVDHAGIEPATS